MAVGVELASVHSLWSRSSRPQSRHFVEDTDERGVTFGDVIEATFEAERGEAGRWRAVGKKMQSNRPERGQENAHSSVCSEGKKGITPIVAPVHDLPVVQSQDLEAGQSRQPPASSSGTTSPSTCNDRSLAPYADSAAQTPTDITAFVNSQDFPRGRKKGQRRGQTFLPRHIAALYSFEAQLSYANGIRSVTSGTSATRFSRQSRHT